MQKILVSVFENFFNPVPIGEVPIDDWLFDSRFRAQVKEIRIEPDKLKRRELKSKLPSITPSGTFSKRCNSGLIQHSGFICMDVDQKDNPKITNWEALKGTITDLDGLYYSGLSASGKGLFLVIKVAYPEKHTEHFIALAADLKNRGVNPDASCGDVTRLRGASFDPQPYYNPSVSPYKKLLTPEIRSVASTELQNPSRTAYRVRNLVEQIERTGVNIADYYPSWYAIGRALGAEFGEHGREWFHTISRQSPKYERKQCNIQYDNCLRTCSKTSIATFFGLCKEFGVTLKK